MDNIVAYKDQNKIMMGSLVEIDDRFGIVQCFDVEFDAEMLFYRIKGKCIHTNQISLDRLLNYIGHRYFYGVEPNVVEVIMFKYLL